MFYLHWRETPSKCTQSKIEKMLMSEAAMLERIEALSQAVVKLQSRVEDLEDLRDLEEAIVDNAGKPLLAWDQAKADLDLE